MWKENRIIDRKLMFKKEEEKPKNMIGTVEKYQKIRKQQESNKLFDLNPTETWKTEFNILYLINYPVLNCI